MTFLKQIKLWFRKLVLILKEKINTFVNFSYRKWKVRRYIITRKIRRISLGWKQKTIRLTTFSYNNAKFHIISPFVGDSLILIITYSLWRSFIYYWIIIIIYRVLKSYILTYFFTKNTITSVFFSEKKILIADLSHIGHRFMTDTIQEFPNKFLTKRITHNVYILNICSVFTSNFIYWYMLILYTPYLFLYGLLKIRKVSKPEFVNYLRNNYLNILKSILIITILFTFSFFINNYTLTVLLIILYRFCLQLHFYYYGKYSEWYLKTYMVKTKTKDPYYFYKSVVPYQLHFFTKFLGRRIWLIDYKLVGNPFRNDRLNHLVYTYKSCTSQAPVAVFTSTKSSKTLLINDSQLLPAPIVKKQYLSLSIIANEQQLKPLSKVWEDFELNNQFIQGEYNPPLYVYKSLLLPSLRSGPVFQNSFEKNRIVIEQKIQDQSIIDIDTLCRRRGLYTDVDIKQYFGLGGKTDDSLIVDLLTEKPDGDGVGENFWDFFPWF